MRLLKRTVASYPFRLLESLSDKKLHSFAACKNKINISGYLWWFMVLEQDPAASTALEAGGRRGCEEGGGEITSSTDFLR
jgi:hypothetical protein